VNRSTSFALARQRSSRGCQIRFEFFLTSNSFWASSEPASGHNLQNFLHYSKRGWDHSWKKSSFFHHAFFQPCCLRGPFLTSPLGANFDPRGEVVPQGWILSPKVKLSVRPSILPNSRECSLLGVNEGMNIPPRGKISPPGSKFTPGGQGWS
jgi:hypothetical protein